MPAQLAPSSPRASIWEWMQTGLLAMNLSWTTLCLGGYRAETMVVTSALNAVMLALHFGRRATSTELPPLHPAGWWLLPFLSYAAANVRWFSPVPWLGWQDWLGWAQLAGVFWIVINDIRTAAARKFLFNVILALAICSVALACYQRFVKPDWLMLGGTQTAQFLARSSGPFAVPNSFAAMLVLVLPAVAFPMWRRGATAVARVWAGYLTAVLLLGLGLTISRGAWIGLTVAVMASPWLVAGIGWRRRMAMSAGILAAVMAAGAVVYTAVPQTRERLDFLMRDGGERSRPVMWRAAWRIFIESPALGGGAGSYSTLFEKHRPEHEQKDPQWAHNDYLNTLSDYGAVGFGLFFGACGVMVWRAARGRRARGSTERVNAVAAMERDDGESRGMVTAWAVGLLAFALHLVVDFHLKIPALAMLAATIAGLSVTGLGPRVDRLRESPVTLGNSWLRRTANGVSGGLILGLGIWWVVPLYRAEGLRDNVRRRLDALSVPGRSAMDRQVVASKAREELSHALELDPANAQAWADRAYATAILGHDDRAREHELGRAAEADARRALAHGRGVPAFFLRLGVGLDLQGRWLEAGAAFSEALRLAPVSATTWFHYAYHLSLNRVTIPLSRAAIATSLRLDHSRPEAESLRQQLGERR